MSLDVRVAILFAVRPLICSSPNFFNAALVFQVSHDLPGSSALQLRSRRLPIARRIAFAGHNHVVPVVVIEINQGVPSAT